MVANITSGADFADMVAYALGRDEPDKKAKILCASDGILLTDTEDFRTVARLFEAYSLRGDHQLRDPLKHISLSWHARDGTRLTDELMLKVMREYMKLMGIEDTEYFATRHHDKKHPHLHFMFSRVNRKGEVIDDSNERERSRKACLYLTKKYGFYISSGKESVNRDRLRGKDKAKYAIYDKVVKCKDEAKNWEEFNDKLKAEGIAMKFRYNNATGKVMGISFSDGKLSFSGSQLDRSLTLPKLTEKFGDYYQQTHNSVEQFYNNYRERLYDINYLDAWYRCEKKYPDWKTSFPGNKLPKFNYPSIPSLLSSVDLQKFNTEEFHTPSDDGKFSYIALDLLLTVLLQPYSPQMAVGSGGGGGGNDKGWRDLDDDDKEKYKYRFLNNHQVTASKPKIGYKPRR